MSAQDLHRREKKNPATGSLNERNPPDGFDSSDLEEILTTTCRAAVELLKVDHSRLMVFDANYQRGEVISEYPPIGTRGLSIQLRGVPAEERLIDSGQPIAIPNISIDPSFSPVNDLLGGLGIQSVLVVPLISNEIPIGSLGLDMMELRKFSDDDIGICQVLAQQAAAVIDLFKRKAEQLAAIKNTAQDLSAYENLRSMLDAIIEQAVHLVSGTGGGIKLFNPERGEMTVIAAYQFPQLIGSKITLWEGLAGEVIRKELRFKAVADYENYPERAPVYAETELFGAVLMINLKWQNRTMGVLFINAERGHKFPTEPPPLLSLLASTAAIAIANSRLIREAEVSQARIQSSYEAAHALISLPDPERILQEIADHALEVADASWVRLIMMDEQGQTRNFHATLGDKLLETNDRIRPNGISRRVLRTGSPYLVEDVSKATEELNPVMLEEGSRAALCLPLSFTGGRLGVIWIHYSAPRTFSNDDVSALQTYLQQASIAYDRTRQMGGLEPLVRATERLAAAIDTKDVLKRIVSLAREIQGADYSVFWEYVENEDESMLQLAVRDAVSDGVDSALIYDMRDTVLPVGDVTRRVMHDGWSSITIDDAAWSDLPVATLKLLEHLSLKRFEGLALVVAQEKLGILYLGYQQANPPGFADVRRRQALAFASHAALALKKAKLVDQVAKSQLITKRMAELTALVDLEPTLNSIVASTKQILDCDAVILFVYDEDTDRILPFTTMTGVNERRRATHCEDAPRTSIVYQMLAQDGPYFVPTVADDERFRDQPFAVREQIESVCAIPLKVERHRVGVMFLNYRSHHTFTDGEMDQIKPFVDQAANCIRFDLRYREQSVKLLQQQFLKDLSEKLLASKSLQESLDLAVKNARELLEADFVAIVVRDSDGFLRIKASWGWKLSDIAAYERSKSSSPSDPSETSQTEYTIKTGETFIAHDYANESLPFKVPALVISQGIRCGMSVPMLDGGWAVGAMLVHYRHKRPLDEAQARALLLIANLTAIAAQHHQTSESKVKLLSALISTSDKISKIGQGTEQRDVLAEIVKQAVNCLPGSFLGTIQTYDKDRKTLRLESVYPPDVDYPQVGTERRLDRRDEGPLGLTGRAVVTKQPQLVKDVFLDADYSNYNQETRSELAVPILDGGSEVLGVLNVESKRPADFGEDDLKALIALANLAAATIQKAEQYRLLEGSTLLAWFGMASSMWGHTLAAKSLNIKKNVNLLRHKLEGRELEPAVQRILDDKLNVIARLASQIRQQPLVSLVQQSEGLLDVEVNKLIDDRLKQLWRNAPYKSAHYRLAPSDKNPLIRCNPDWIKQVLDILIDNALDAKSDPSAAQLTIATEVINERQVEITVADNGPGIPEQLIEKLFKQRIENGRNSKGLGMGLLMLQVIAYIHRGKVGITRTNEKGTTMYVRLPILNGAAKIRPDR